MLCGAAPPHGDLRRLLPGSRPTSPKWSAQPLHRQDAFSIPLKTATLKLDALNPLDPVQGLDQLVG